MADQNPQESGDSEGSLRLDLEHRWADIARAIGLAMIRTRQPALLWVDVRVDANGIQLSGRVTTRREHDLAAQIAERHACGLPVRNAIRIWAETTSRINE